MLGSQTRTPPAPLLLIPVLQQLPQPGTLSALCHLRKVITGETRCLWHLFRKCPVLKVLKMGV